MNTQWMKKHWFKTILLALMGVCILLVGSCAFVTRDRVVSWEEEVLLNTGETIIAKRTVPWSFQGGAGNPLSMAMRPNVSQEVLQFTYKGKDYSYSGGAAVGWIVISKEGIPNLVAIPSSYGWARRNFYYCTDPFYVQFKPSGDGKTWTWPKNIEPWLYGLPYNLMAVIPKLDEKIKKRYPLGDRSARDDGVTRDPRLSIYIQIDANFKTNECPSDPATMNLPNSNWNTK
jgi:hypothetical protein